MAHWDLLLTNVTAATLAGTDYGVVENAAIAVQDGRIAWLGPVSAMPAGEALMTRDLAGRWVTPALIDCHTHLVFAGDRAAEFEQRLNGVSYEEIAKSGGGIRSTVSATRAASAADLSRSAERRLQCLLNEGVATIEIKSGYGLDIATESRMLSVARALASQSRADVSTTFLGAHAIPEEYAGNADSYIDFVINESLPAAHTAGLVDAVDAFCENIAFSAEQVARVFDKAAELGLPVKLHADQLSDGGGAELAASYAALSVDHIEYTSDAGVKALADAGTVAVLLPGAFVTLGETQLPPIDTLRKHGVPIAVATDCNPGSSPVCSLRAAMSLASSVFGLTPLECLAGVTRNAAQALGLQQDRGTLEIGKRADIAVWDFAHPRELSYWLGLNPLVDLYVAGNA